MAGAVGRAARAAEPADDHEDADECPEEEEARGVVHVHHLHAAGSSGDGSGSGCAQAAAIAITPVVCHAPACLGDGRVHATTARRSGQHFVEDEVQRQVLVLGQSDVLDLVAEDGL